MISSWNIRGLNGPLKQEEIRSLVLSRKIVVLGILETRIKEENLLPVWKILNLANWEVVHNHESDVLGRIWVIYNPTRVKLTVIKSGAQFIHCQIEWEDKFFLWTYVYGSYEPEVRRKLWSDLLDLSCGIDVPWLVQGDFNAIMSDLDRVGGNPVNEVAAEDLKTRFFMLISRK